MKQLPPSSYDNGTSTTPVFPDALAELLPAGWPTDIPLVRISTCGHLTVEVLCAVEHPSDGHVTFVYRPPVMPHNGGTTALNLLKLLISQQGHFATKDWLMETLRYSKPEEEEDDLWAGLARLDNMVSLLRGILCPRGIPGEWQAAYHLGNQGAFLAEGRYSGSVRTETIKIPKSQRSCKRS